MSAAIMTIKRVTTAADFISYSETLTHFQVPKSPKVLQRI
jgi:hypothetical protein